MPALFGLPDRPQLLVIGIDGADYQITEWLMQQGRLTHLKALAERGAWGPARSTIPPLTPAAWTTIMTGKNPGKHGVFDFLPMNGDPLDVPVGSRRRATTIWRALSEQGYRVGTFNLPVTYPPEPLSGFQVSGFTAPGFNPSIASPDRAFEVLREAGQGYAPFAPPAREEAPAERQLRDRIDLVPIVSRRLLSAMPCDVFMANFQVVDWVQHSAIASEMRPGDPTSLDPDGLIARTYQLVDERIGVMLGELTSPSTHIIVISDHGAAVVDRVVNLEKLFLDNGLMAYTSASTGKGRSLRWGRLRARIALSVWQALKRHAPGLAARLRPTGLKVRDRLAAYESDVRVDWSRTAAAPWGLYGQVRFNVRGRDPQGAVTPDQLPQLRRQIRALVLGLKDPVTGLPIYDEVREAEDVYSGPFVCDGPDLILVPSDSRYLTVCGRMFRESSVPFLDAQREVVVPLDPPRDFHSAQGIFGMAGPDVEPGRRLSPMDLVDFVPTALHLLNEPIPTDMDGHPVLEALSVERRRRQPVRLGDPWPPPETTPAEAAYTAEEQRELEKQLVSLGYI